jgi:hypothetical protein
MSRNSLPAFAMAAAGLLMMRPDVMLRSDGVWQMDRGDGLFARKIVRPQVTDGFDDGCTAPVPRLWLGARTKAVCGVHNFVTPVGPNTLLRIVRSSQTTPVGNEDAVTSMIGCVPAAPWPEAPLGTTDALRPESVGASRRQHHRCKRRRHRVKRSEAFQVRTWLVAVAGAVLGLLFSVNPVAAWAWASALGGVGLLVTDTHFGWPECLALSLNYWCAAAWAAWAVSWYFGAALVLVAVGMRRSALLFGDRNQPAGAAGPAGTCRALLFPLQSLMLALPRAR